MEPGGGPLCNADGDAALQGEIAEQLQNYIVAGSYMVPWSCSEALRELLGCLLSTEAWVRFKAKVARAHWWFGPCGKVPRGIPSPL